jgi:hypothetical protein
MNISISLATEQEYQRISFARELIKTNLDILNTYINNKDSKQSIDEYLSQILDNYSIEEIVEQMQNLELWLDNIMNVVKHMDSLTCIDPL